MCTNNNPSPKSKWVGGTRASTLSIDLRERVELSLFEEIKFEQLGANNHIDESTINI